MAIHVYAYAPTDPDREKRARDERFFCDNLPLLLEHGQDIVAHDEYFFCPLSFAYCAFLWIGGGGPFCLGQLLLGWSDGVLTESCPDCRSQLLITNVSGSILSGCNSWSGFCVACCDKRFGRNSDWMLFRNRMDFALAVRKQFPHKISYWEEYDGFIFSWGGNGLQPARKKRLIVKAVVEPVGLEVLVDELKTGNIRKGNPPQPRVVQTKYELELRFKNGGVLTAPVELLAPDDTR